MQQISNKLLIVVSTMPGDGPTGVETHFNQIMLQAANANIRTQLVTPHKTNWLLRKVPNGFGRLLKLINIELGILWNRIIAYKILKYRLTNVLKANLNCNVVMYAQDPLSASVALDVKKNIDCNCRVVAVSHFNVSEANEGVERGVISEGGLVWRELMLTELNSLPRVDHLIFVSRFMSQKVNKRIPELLKVKQSVIPNFPELPYLSTQEIGAKMGDIIAIGTLEPRKNQAYLIQVLAACKRQGKKYKLTLVGDGPDRVQLIKLATDLNVLSQVSFLGYIKNASRLIPNHRLVVHAAKVENMPITLIEALSYGCPVIASNVGGISEVISEDVNGKFWSLDDVDGGADTLITLLEESNDLKKMSIKALEVFNERFHPNVLSGKWLNTIFFA